MARALLASFADNFKLTDPDAPLTPRQWKVEILSGLTVALALVPEAVAFAFVAGVEPLVGLYAAFIVGLITAVFGGRPGMISGATGASYTTPATTAASRARSVYWRRAICWPRAFPPMPVHPECWRNIFTGARGPRWRCWRSSRATPGTSRPGTETGIRRRPRTSPTA